MYSFVRLSHQNSQVFGHSVLLEAHTEHYHRETLRDHTPTGPGPSGNRRVNGLEVDLLSSVKMYTLENHDIEKCFASNTIYLR